ncbi:hypothetical protein [Paraclostridium bifermentans]|uniref:hypothetical protein n=1 Tax=Paraclostridium bifermentans TaxID=1490 RepID=UPI001FF5DF05|nr:hypothetical protein [Paraclostridium bifermentans]UOW69546.1 hypothetical protein MTR78_16945 [Paraclostridium bifermentans]
MSFYINFYSVFVIFIEILTSVAISKAVLLSYRNDRISKVTMLLIHLIMILLVVFTYFLMF